MMSRNVIENKQSGHHDQTTKRKRSRSKSLVKARKRLYKKRQRRTRQQQHADDQYHNGLTTSTSKQTNFEGYTNLQGLWSNENERQQMFYILKQPLPICFRIRDPTLVNEFKNQIVLQLPSYIQCNEIQMGIYKHVYQISGLTRRDELMTNPELFQLKHFLSKYTSTGQIVRQELVSMIPCLLLQIESHHKVLDMCASPGSKTTQAVDALYDNGSSDKVLIPKGFVIANDANLKRCYVLAHRCTSVLKERSQSVMMTHHNSIQFPNVNAPLKRNSNQPPSSSEGEGCYDRIICDVPCSGDGTLRKDVKVWNVWHSGYGLKLHPIQLSIALRGLRLLKIGGYMTYSTCSFNPIENEAVVYELLKRSRGCLELVDPTPILSKEAPTLKWRHGWNHWLVIGDENDDDEEDIKTQEPSHYSTYEETLLLKNKRQRHRFRKSMWPRGGRVSCDGGDPDGTICNSLHRCVRMMPHDNNTGGFFIALLKKVAPWNPHPYHEHQHHSEQRQSSRSTTTSKDNQDKNVVSSKRKSSIQKQQRTKNKESCHTFRPIDNNSLNQQQADTNTNQDDDNKNHNECCWFTRSPQQTTCSNKVFAVCSQLAHHAFDSQGSDKLKIVTAGQRLSRQQTKII